MRLKAVVASIICAFAMGGLPVAKAQVITATPDSVQVPVPPALPDSTLGKTKGFNLSINEWSRPAKAAFYSTVLPGLGQAYNKSYWKIPLIYATGGVIGFFIYDNNRKYQGFAQALRVRFDGDPNTLDAYVEDNIYGVGKPNDQGSLNLRSSRDFFRKYRDLDIILAVLAWGLNVMEAHVDAHLKAFDVSEDLTLQFKPNVTPLLGTPTYAPGFSLQLTLK